MLLVIVVIGAIVLAAIVSGPFIIKSNSLAQALYGVITTAMATGAGIWASWRYSKSSDKERLIRYGLLAWRNIDSLSLKVRQQIQQGPAKQETLESWLLDIDQAKWGWRDLLRELFELQERLELESEEISIKYREKMDAAESHADKAKIENQLKIELARISGRAPMPLSERMKIECPNCRKQIDVTLKGEVGSTSWPKCNNCGARFPVHRRSDGEAIANPTAIRLPVKAVCPRCDTEHELMLSLSRSVSFTYECYSCGAILKCDGTATDFTFLENDADEKGKGRK